MNYLQKFDMFLESNENYTKEEIQLQIDDINKELGEIDINRYPEKERDITRLTYIKSKLEKKLNQINENMNSFYKIETSLGIIEIPTNIINKSSGMDKDAEYYKILKTLYDFVCIYKVPEKPGWLFIELSDSYYGDPEYKIIN